jgi:pyruvate/2-oxoglutarate/acetoin dehydrogenase E1 component
VEISPFHPVGELLRGAVLQTDRPTLFVENKLMYARRLRLPDDQGFVGEAAARIGGGLYPTIHLSMDSFSSCDVLIIAAGSMAEIAMESAERLMIDREIAVDVLVPAQISPLPLDDLIEPVVRSRRVVVLEEGIQAWGWGSEVVAALHEETTKRNVGAIFSRVGARASAIPVSRPLEESILPQVQNVIDAVVRLTQEGAR